MFSANKHPIALISVHGDPAIDIGREEAGGQNVYVRQVGESLARLGWDVTMFTRRTSESQVDVVEHLSNCRTVRLTAGPADFISRDHIFEYLPSFVSAFLTYQDRMGHKFALVHTNYWLSSWVGMELKKFQPIAQLHTYHSLGAIKYQTVDHIPAIAETRLNIERRCLETAECVVATSPQERDHLRSLVSEQGNIEIIPCGTDVNRFGTLSRLDAREKLGIDQDAKLVFYIGRFDRRKGIETIVRAVGETELRSLPNLQMLIGGGSKPGRSDGIERDRIEGIVQTLAIQDIVKFPGRISDHDLALYYAAADVTVVPSHYEPFGLVAIEAMASYTPVIASSVGGLQFTVQNDHTGLLVPPRDAIAFSHAIKTIVMDPDYRDRLGQAARQRVVDCFSWDGVAQQLDALYESHLMRSPAPHLNQASA